MKRLILLMGIVLSTLVATAQFSSASLQASGLTCALCTKAINKSLEQLPFVESVNADIKTSSFRITFKKDADVNIDALRKGVEDAGFSVAKLQLTANFNNVRIENDAHQVINGKAFHFLSVKPRVLDGEQQLTLVDKNFVQAKDFKKYSASSKMSCVQTGKAGDCCRKNGLSAETRIYHVTI